MSGRARSATTSSSNRCLCDCRDAFPDALFRSTAALTMRRIGIDVGGTNTDAVLLDGEERGRGGGRICGQGASEESI